ncbi:octopamine receptor isoform X3 [Amyelois transitella]|uniref:octopamine receptor isoform X3 n=1 Tax=Amyelois transitella TaxID=680683 RepID=UPI0029901FE3|nr:octopamine receptor isoform X3 [Amyelois transitella]
MILAVNIQYSSHKKQTGRLCLVNSFSLSNLIEYIYATRLVRNLDKHKTFSNEIKKMMFLNLHEFEEHVSVNLIPEDIERIAETHKYFSQIVGLLIIVTNLSVVVTSGLILKKAVQPKSTYMLLGNISLADSILGVAMVLSSLVDKAITTGAPLQEDSESISIHTVCMIVQALRMCPAVVSILSIGFIAADRYVYLIHGLYYKTWISTKRVRISIACIWIAGILFTIPGWVNINNVSRCYFIEIFPTGLMLTLTALSFINITFVTTLYTIILVKAVKANNKIQKAKKIAKISQKEKISNNITYNLSSDNNNTHNIHFTVLDVEALESDQKISIDENKNENTKQSEDKIPEMIQNTTMENPDHSTNNKLSDPSNNTNLNRSVSSYIDLNKIQNKCKENKKCRAITVVILTTGSFIITWVPFLMSVVYYGFICEKYNTKHYCEMSCQYVIRPLWALALLNSLLNPFIYAWWHHGFKDYVRSCYKKCFRR